MLPVLQQSWQQEGEAVAQLTENASAHDALRNEKKRNYKVAINENSFLRLFSVFLPKLENKNMKTTWAYFVFSVF